MQLPQNQFLRNYRKEVGLVPEYHTEYSRVGPCTFTNCILNHSLMEKQRIKGTEVEQRGHCVSSRAIEHLV
jgi:hypothetical protein